MRTISHVCRTLALLVPLAVSCSCTALSDDQQSSPTAVTQAAPPASAGQVSEQASEQTTAANAPHTESQGDAFLAVGRYIAAMQTYSSVEPKSAAIYNKLGVACEHMRMNDPARENFEKALRFNPNYAEVYNNLGTLAHIQGDYRQAEKSYKRSIHLDPHNPDAEKNLGTLYYARRKFRKGDECYRRAHDLDKDIFSRSARAPVQASSAAKDSADLHYHLAKTYAKAGSDQLAIDFLRQAINEGFRDRKRLMSEQEFAALWNTPAFMKLVEDLRTN